MKVKGPFLIVTPLSVAIQWQKEIEAKYTEIDKLYKAYQADAILLTDDMKKKNNKPLFSENNNLTR